MNNKRIDIIFGDVKNVRIRVGALVAQMRDVTHGPPVSSKSLYLAYEMF